MRRCTTVPGFGACCQAAQAGTLGQAIRINTAHGQRCGMCTPIQKRRGGSGFKFRFLKSAQCGLVSGCPVAGTAGLPQLGFQR